MTAPALALLVLTEHPLYWPSPEHYICLWVEKRTSKKGGGGGCGEQEGGGEGVGRKFCYTHTDRHSIKWKQIMPPASRREIFFYNFLIGASYIYFYL